VTDVMQETAEKRFLVADAHQLGDLARIKRGGERM